MLTVQGLIISFLLGAYLTMVLLALKELIAGSLNRYGLWLTEGRLRKMMRRNNNG
jgi:hypothetical protein